MTRMNAVRHASGRLLSWARPEHLGHSGRIDILYFKDHFSSPRFLREEESLLLNCIYSRQDISQIGICRWLLLLASGATLEMLFAVT
jgi:hypothetical protein